MTINKKLFAGTFYTFFVNGVMAIMLGTLIKFLADDYGINYKIQGYLMSTQSIGNLLASFTISISAFLIGRKRSIIIFAVVMFLSYLGIIIFNALWLWFILFLLTGIARGSVSNVNNAIINDAATGKSIYLNMLHMFFAVGAFTTPLISSFINRAGLGWKATVIFGLFFVFTMIVTYVFMPIPKNVAANKESGEPQDAVPFYKKAPFYLAALVLFFYLGVETTLNVWIITYLVDTGRMSEFDSQIILSSIWVIIIFGRLSAAFLSAKIQKTMLILSASVSAAFMFCVFALSHNSSIIRIAIMLFAFFFAAIYPTTIAAAGKIIKGSSAAVGTLLAIAGAGGIIFPAVTGLTANAFNINAGMIPAAIAMLLTVFFAVALRIKLKD